MKDAKLSGKIVRLEGRGSDLQYLSERFRSNDFAIIKYGEEYFLKIASFDSKTQARESSTEQHDREVAELLDSARKLVRLINGEAQLERKLFGSMNGEMQFEDQEILPIQAVKDVHEFREGKQVNGVAIVEARLTDSQLYKFGLLSGKLTETTPTPAILAKQRKLMETHFPLELAKLDIKVEEALTYFGYPHDWNNLYRTWDVIGSDLNELPRDNVINKDNDDRFKKTANHFRHGGHQKSPLPDNPMSLGEADHYVKVFLLAWLNFREFQQ